jgi:hypothetical protein
MKMKMRRLSQGVKRVFVFVTALLLMCFAFTVPRAEAASKLALISTNQVPSESRDIIFFKKFCAENGCDVIEVEQADITSGKVNLKDYNGATLFYIIDYGDAFWQKLAAYVAEGGKLFWSGTYGTFKDIGENGQKGLLDVFKARMMSYIEDPQLGKGPIETMMWIKPTSEHVIFEDKEITLYAIFSGEAMGFEPAADGKTIACWVNRDQKTESGGPSIIVSENNAGGKTVLLGVYSLNLIARGSEENSLVSKQIHQLYIGIFKWLGIFTEKK